MKYLILLLPIISFADVKIEVTNSITGKSYRAKFETQLEADAWKAEQINDNSWGKPDKWERKEIGDTCPGAERTSGDAQTGFFNECFYPVEYTITETDISAEVNARQAKRDACQVLEVKLKTPVNLTLEEMNDYMRCK